MRHYIVKSQVKNILNVFNQSTQHEKNEGANWYLSAHNFARSLASKYDKDVFIVCGIIAALSPAISWEQNKIDTETFLRLKKGKRKVTTANVSTYGPNLGKAEKIYKATSINEVAVTLKGKTGLKTMNFFYNIFCPVYIGTINTPITIDRHAYKIAHKNTKGGGVSLTAKKYRETKQAYLNAAKLVNIHPVKLQAITWCTYRRLIGLVKTEVEPF